MSNRALRQEAAPRPRDSNSRLEWDRITAPEVRDFRPDSVTPGASRELLPEAQALQYAFCDLDGKTRRAVA